MNSLIWWELLHKGVQSIKWKSDTYWHYTIRAFYQFCATYKFWICTVYILSWNSDSTVIGAESWYQCTVSAAIYWPEKMLLKLMIASSLPQIINQNHSYKESSVMCMLHSIKAEHLTLSSQWWDCTVGYAEWSHPATCLSWCRNLQTYRSAGKRQRKAQQSALYKLP